MAFDYISHFRKLEEALQVEKQEEIDVYKELTEQSSFRDRVEAGITLYPIELREMRYNELGDQIIEVKKNPNQEGSEFGLGRLVSIFQHRGRILRRAIDRAERNQNGDSYSGRGY
jgi:hypothetical protein